jgi:asparagine synthase (glutamine-hydrolysing)
MSGICGFTGMGEESILRNMFNQISNSETFIPFSNKSVSFCGNSLTVSDNSANSKIISNENESVFLAFDGEIYNYKDLRDELITLGHTFKSESQHEVVVHLYEEAGQNAFGRINGIFSAVLWDENRDELFLFIDKLGIKQIFFTFCDDVFLFGSAMKTIIQYPDFKRELDEITLNHFLTLEFTPTERTLIKGISRLQPGHFLVYRKGKVTVSHYWNFSIGVSNEPEDFYIRTLRRLFEESVRKSTTDCHTIGALLSGGMDSSALVALLHTVSDKPIKTFSVYLGEESSTDRDSDWKYARLVAERFGTDHHEMVLDDLVLDRLPYFIWINEGPGMSLVPLLMRESVKKHVDVVFTGRGLDEILGGQGRFAKIRYINLAGKMHKYVPKLVPALFADIIELPRSLLVEHIPECDRYLRYLNILPSFGNKTFFYSSIIPGYVRTDKRFLYAPALSHTRAENTNELFSPYFSKDGDILNEMLLAESKTRLSAILLNFDHKISNYIGLIERAPLADPDIVTFSFTIPSHLKVRNNCTKYILRKTMSDVLPKEIIHRKKAGGYVPKSYVLLTKTDLREKIISTLPEWNLIKNGYIREDYFHNILSRPASPKLNRQYKLILYLLSLEIWYNIFIAPKTACKPVSDKIETYLGTRG